MELECAQLFALACGGWHTHTHTYSIQPALNGHTTHWFLNIDLVCFCHLKRANPAAVASRVRILYMDLKGMDNKVNGLSKTFNAITSSENSV